MAKQLFYHDGEWLDDFDTVEAAILSALSGWHEDEKPGAFTIRDEEGMVAATISPVGSDKAIVVYAHGQIDEYSEIHYFKENDRYVGCKFYYNSATLMTEVRW